MRTIDGDGERPVTAFLRRRPLTAFLLLAFLGSWIAWSPMWLSRNGLGLLPFELPFPALAGVNQLGLFAGPFAAGLLVTRVAKGREGLRELLRRTVRWRVHPGWLLLALVGVPAACAVGFFLPPGRTPMPPAELPATLASLAGLAVLYLLGGPIQEEPGWRGVALPRLQERLAPLPAALVLGVIHCAWHAPLFLVAAWDTPRDDPGQLLAYLLLVTGLSVVASWLYNGSGGSVLLAILAHNSVNWALLAAGTLHGEQLRDSWPAALGMAALAALAIALSRGRLGLLPARDRADGAGSR